MPRKRKLRLRREDADPDLAGIDGREREDGLRQAQLAGNALHLLAAEAARVGQHGELVALERSVGEDVQEGIAARRRGRAGPRLPAQGVESGEEVDRLRHTGRLAAWARVPHPGR